MSINFRDNTPEAHALSERLVQVESIKNRMGDRDERTEDVMYDPVGKTFYYVEWWSNMSYDLSNHDSGHTAEIRTTTPALIEALRKVRPDLADALTGRPG